MKKLIIKDEFIKLGQALKLSGISSTGVEAKDAVTSGMVKVNRAIETRRGRKLYNGDVFSCSGESYEIVSEMFNDNNK